MLERSYRIVLLAALLASGCATLDTSRPIDKSSVLIGTNYEQDGRTLNYFSTVDKLAQIPASRESAERSMSLKAWSGGLMFGGVAAILTAPRLAEGARRPVTYAGLGLFAAGLVPELMSLSEFGRAVDAYNGTFQRSSTPAPLTFVFELSSGGAHAAIGGAF